MTHERVTKVHTLWLQSTRRARKSNSNARTLTSARTAAVGSLFPNFILHRVSQPSVPITADRWHCYSPFKYPCLTPPQYPNSWQTFPWSCLSNNLRTRSPVSMKLGPKIYISSYNYFLFLAIPTWQHCERLKYKQIYCYKRYRHLKNNTDDALRRKIKWRRCNKYLFFGPMTATERPVHK